MNTTNQIATKIIILLLVTGGLTIYTDGHDTTNLQKEAGSLGQGTRDTSHRLNMAILLGYKAF